MNDGGPWLKWLYQQGDGTIRMEVEKATQRVRDAENVLASACRRLEVASAEMDRREVARRDRAWAALRHSVERRP